MIEKIKSIRRIKKDLLRKEYDDIRDRIQHESDRFIGKFTMQFTNTCYWCRILNKYHACLLYTGYVHPHVCTLHSVFTLNYLYTLCIQR